MKEFFKVTDLDAVLEWPSRFVRVEPEIVPIDASYNRLLAKDVVSDVNLPDFARSIMDGYAVSASSTFGATESNPAYLSVHHTVAMGESPGFSIRQGEAAKISTGGMLPKGADSVIMVEHTDSIDDTTIEVYRSVAPGQNIIEIGEDIQAADTILCRGTMTPWTCTAMARTSPARPAPRTMTMATWMDRMASLAWRPRVTSMRSGCWTITGSATPVT